MFDAVSVIILVEHTLMTDLFGTDLPGVCFRDKEEYLNVKNEVLYRLGLDPSSFSCEESKQELKRRCSTPSPVRRLEDSIFINNNSYNYFGYDMNSTFNDAQSMITS